MRRLTTILLLTLGFLLAGRLVREIPGLRAGGVPTATENGDVNGDALLDLSDAVYLLNHLFNGGPEPVAIAQESSLTAEQQEILSHLSLVDLPTDEEGNTARTIVFTGVNVQIVNGLGATNGNSGNPLSIDPEDTSTNGLGNLIVGYQETRGGRLLRTGSHNIVVGARHDYTTFGGLVAGNFNNVHGPYSSVSGGRFNEAAGDFSSVSGGRANKASGSQSSVSGGRFNIASGNGSSVNGGKNNTASAFDSSVSGGAENIAQGPHSAVGGGVSQFESAPGGFVGVSVRQWTASNDNCSQLKIFEVDAPWERVIDAGVLWVTGGGYNVLVNGPVDTGQGIRWRIAVEQGTSDHCWTAKVYANILP